MTVGRAEQRNKLPLVLGTVAALALLGGAIGGAILVFRGDSKTAAVSTPSSEVSALAVEPVVDVTPSAPQAGPRGSAADDVLDGGPPTEGKQPAERTKRVGAATRKPRAATSTMRAIPSASTPPGTAARSLEERLAF